jgi:hypothetical protein
MKKILFLLLALTGITASAQVNTTYFEAKDAFATFTMLKQIPAEQTGIVLKEMQKVNVQQLLEEDQILDELGGYPSRFGYGMDVNYTLKDGVWEKQGAENVWSLRITSKGAYSLNFIFSELALSPEAELYIFNPDGSMVYGPVTAEQNLELPGQLFLTDLVAGDEAVIQIIEPNTYKEASTLRISRVVHAYKNTFSWNNAEAGVRAAALTCYNNIACYPAWETESNAVALVLISGGDAFCSGSLLNNTSQDFKPYFLSAFHCVDLNHDGTLSNAEITTAENWAFRFQYKTTTCNGSTVASYFTYNQDNFRAGWANSDFALVELKTASAQSDSRLTFLGWDRTSNISSSGTTIHHPNSDVMKISFDNDPLTTNSTAITIEGTVFSANTLWVTGLDNGTAEDGSSGASLFNTGKRVIGQLTGGANACPPNVTKFFGRFDISWTGNGTNSTRLSNWLNPSGSSATTLNSLTQMSGPSLVPCTGTVTYSLPAVGASATITWNVGNLQIVSGQGTKTIVVQKSSSSTGASTAISATVTQAGVTTTVKSKNVAIGAPTITSITGPSTARVGSYATYYALPDFPASQGDYEWVVSPSTASKSVYRRMCDVTFNQSGTYAVGVRSTSACTSPGSYTMMTVSVSSSYAVSYGTGKQLTVTPSGLNGSAAVIDASQTIAYTLYNQSTGATAASGRISAQGGTLDFSSAPAGVYLLNLEVADNIFDTHRVALK